MTKVSCGLMKSITRDLLLALVLPQRSCFKKISNDYHSLCIRHGTDRSPHPHLQDSVGIWVLVLDRVQRIYKNRKIRDLRKVDKYFVESGRNSQVHRNCC